MRREYPAVSCVEHYFLDWFGEFCDERLLYADAFLSLKQLETDFAEGHRYETYPALPRVQEVAERLGLCTHERCAFPLTGAEPAGDLLLIRVKPGFSDSDSVRPRREDHYLRLLGREGEKFLYRNSYPRKDGELTAAQLTDAAQGTVLHFRRSACADASCLRELCRAQFERIIHAPPREAPHKLSLRAYRDLAGILKASRERVRLWLELMAERGKLIPGREPDALLREDVRDAERMQLQAELQLRRGRADDGALCGAMERIAERELALCKLIKMRRIEHEDYE